jgi:hypothetical protein
MKDVQFNLNDIVIVKLTDIGKKIFLDLDRNVDKRIIKIVGNNIYSKRIDNDGCVNMQMWEVMKVFGNHMALAMDSPIEMNVIIKTQSKIN